jgi:hypothetical protein
LQRIGRVGNAFGLLASVVASFITVSHNSSIIIVRLLTIEGFCSGGGKKKGWRIFEGWTANVQPSLSDSRHENKNSNQQNCIQPLRPVHPAFDYSGKLH